MGAALIGSYRRFGDLGPAYQVLGADGPERVQVVVLETGEELSCRIDEVRCDPDISNGSVSPIFDPQQHIRVTAPSLSTQQE